MKFDEAKFNNFIAKKAFGEIYGKALFDEVDFPNWYSFYNGIIQEKVEDLYDGDGFVLEYLEEYYVALPLPKLYELLPVVFSKYKGLYLEFVNTVLK